MFVILTSFSRANQYIWGLPQGGSEICIQEQIESSKSDWECEQGERNQRSTSCIAVPARISAESKACGNFEGGTVRPCNTCELGTWKADVSNVVWVRSCAKLCECMAYSWNDVWKKTDKWILTDVWIKCWYVIAFMCVNQKPMRAMFCEQTAMLRAESMKNDHSRIISQRTCLDQIRYYQDMMTNAYALSEQLYTLISHENASNKKHSRIDSKRLCPGQKASRIDW